MTVIFIGIHTTFYDIIFSILNLEIHTCSSRTSAFTILRKELSTYYRLHIYTKFFELVDLCLFANGYILQASNCGKRAEASRIFYLVVRTGVMRNFSDEEVW
ncbi:hypothetical protein ACJX0J_006604, partial [Zea mays]